MIKSLKDLLDKFSRFTNSLVYDGGICKRLKIKENKEYSKYLKDKEGEEVIKFHISADYIKTDYYPKMKEFIEGDNPEYKKFVCGKTHTKKSLIQKRENNTSSKLC